MTAFAKYSLSPVNGALQIEFTATATKKTPVNLASHMYFNLAGHESGKDGMYQHTIQINAEKYTPVSADLIPTGVIQNVQDTSFDLRVPKMMGDILASKYLFINVKYFGPKL